MTPETRFPTRTRAHRRGRVRLPDGGMTLTEMMIVVVILGILSSIATPLLFRDRKGEKTRSFAGGVAREFQRMRQMAISSRLPVNAYVFRDRVEFRTFTLPTLAGGAPNPLAAPVAPNIGDPPMLVIAADPGIEIWAVTTNVAPAPAAAVLNTAPPPATFRFNTRGGIDDGVNAGGGAAVNDIPLQVFWITNRDLTAGHSEGRFRIELTGLTAFTRLVNRW